MYVLDLSYTAGPTFQWPAVYTTETKDKNIFTGLNKHLHHINTGHTHAEVINGLKTHTHACVWNSQTQGRAHTQIRAWDHLSYHFSVYIHFVRSRYILPIISFTDLRRGGLQVQPVTKTIARRLRLLFVSPLPPLLPLLLLSFILIL